MNLARNENFEFSLFIVRIWLGIIMIWHSFPILFQGQLTGFTEYVGSLGIPIPIILAPVSKLIEFVGGLMLIAGLYTRIVALFLLLNMLIAVGAGHSFRIFADGELAMSYVIISLCLSISGGGKFALKKL